jgi:STE24 endopeptidase
MLERWMLNRLPTALLNNDAFRVGSIALLAGTVIFGQGYLSRRFERQADVFAARMMEVDWGGLTPQPDQPPAPPPETLPEVPTSHVGLKGAQLFSTALTRVAFVNNIPINARGLLHPSIARRLSYLDEMSGDPLKTSRFDRKMGHIYALLIFVLMTCGTLAAAVLSSLTI